MRNLLELFFAGFVIYLIYRLVFDLIIPVSKAASQVKSKINEMHHTQENYKRQTQQQANPTPQPSDKANTDGEYIEFEEVK